jgi:hypothetical protein
MLHRTFRHLTILVAISAVSGLALSAACASKTQTSGETHFLCKVDADCASLGADYACRDQKCQMTTATDGGGGSPGTDGGGAGGAGGGSCAPGCVPAYGYPLDQHRNGPSCVDLARKELLGCFCANQTDLPAPQCRIRSSDQTIFLGEITSLVDPGAYGDCPGSMFLDFHACDFSSCVTAPPSWCNREDTCKSIRCGSVEFESNGCMRTMCSSDADCTSTDRCVFLNCESTSSCAYSGDGTCACGGPLPCIHAHFCNATDGAGPRGDWTALEFDQGSGPCPPGQDCTATWRLTPDGHLAMSKFGTVSSATVDSLLLDAIVGIIDGPDLRSSLRDGFTCDPPPTDVGWSMKLELSTGPLQNDVTGCLTTGPDGNLAKQVFDYLKNY